ncbi:MAG: histidinol dehydrogenase [Gammaproteobacteria bacterium HGW-Gammaproteobacteria-8]|nr:MAG: histidinol dehydrogenase [Gammaproteobacteria bacterium HGW-Gammaproteobacteria-8]
MKSVTWNALDEAARNAVLNRPRIESDAELEAIVGEIITNVRANGDAALLDYSRRFDRVPAAALWQASDDRAALDPALEAALDRAIETVRAFHQAGKPADYEVETAPGVRCRMRYLALDPVGLYVPAGTAPLPSTAVMLLVPARLAGCREIVLATPPNAQGRADDAVLYVAAKLGLERVLVAGGAQAIAAMAYGTETVPACAKLFGPGNRFVAEAKRQAALDVAGAAQDLPAGPSEVLVIADDSANPEWVAIDLLSQAEHGPDSQVLLVTNSEALAGAVEAEVERLLARLSRGETTAKALQYASIVQVSSMEQAIEVSERYAPEHLIIQTRDAAALAERIRTAGSVFVGHHTPESLGDYISGTNHTLPTGGWARTTSGLAVTDFMRRMTLQSATPGGLAELGPPGARIAAHEGLDAHRLAIELRLGRPA